MKIANGRYLIGVELGKDADRPFIVPTVGSKVLWDSAQTLDPKELERFLERREDKRAARKEKTAGTE